MVSKKNYEYYDIFKKSCSYENGLGDCKKTRESKKCIDDKCEKIVIPESKKEVLQDYYNQINYDNEENVNYKQIKDNLKLQSQEQKEEQAGGGKNIPKDASLYNSVKKAANKKFKSPSGIYRSSWIVKEYLRRGGKYSGSKDKSSGLSRWFKEKWVDLNRPIKNSKGKVIGYKKCGRKTQKIKGKYPLCRPSKSVNKKSPRTYKEISKKSLSKAKRDKKSSNNIKFGGGSQDGGYYGSPKLKKKILSNLKKKECPVCKMIIKSNKKEHIQSHLLKPKEREILQIGNGKCNECGALCFAPIQSEDGTEVECDGCGKSMISVKKGGGKVRSQFKGTLSKIMVKVPINVKKTALYSYKLKDMGFKGGIETGNKRAKQLSTKSEIPIEDLKFMKAWFARHMYASYPSYKKWQDAGRPKDKEWYKKHGILAWVLWSGDAGFKWVNSKKNINLLNKHYPGKNYKATKLKLTKK
jgi:hypothetical protein